MRPSVTGDVETCNLCGRPRGKHKREGYHYFEPTAKPVDLSEAIDTHFVEPVRAMLRAEREARERAEKALREIADAGFVRANSIARAYFAGEGE